MNIRENRCIDASIKFLEGQLNATLSNFSCPENDLSITQNMRIDALAEIGLRKFAFEHTIVEPYEGHIESHAATKWAEDKLRAMLKDLQLSVGLDVLLPADWYEKIVRGRPRNEFLTEIATLITTRKTNIERMADNDRPEDLETIQGVEVQICRNSLETIDDEGLEICIGLFAGNYKTLRKPRIERSLLSKLPKLEKWANVNETILVLENRDISLTNVWSVVDTLQTLWNSDQSIPCDFVFYINASHSTWRLHPIIFERKWRHTKSNGLIRSFKFDEADLSPDLS